jgi:hypothetical protein
MKDSTPLTRPGARRSDRLERVVAAILLVGGVLVPVAVSFEGIAVFRLPNQLVMIATAIVALTTTVSGMLWSPERACAAWPRMRLPVLLAAGGVVWTLTATLFSSDRRVSLNALPFVISLITIALLSVYALRSVRPLILGLALSLPVVVNAVVISLQATGIWNPWVFKDEFQQMYKNALLGNPNDVGAYMLTPLFLMAALALGLPRFRAAFLLLACVSAAGIVIAETLTAIIATLAGLTVMAVRRFGRKGLAGVVVVILVFVSPVFFYRPLHNRVFNKVAAASESRIDHVLSGRLPAFVTAWKMFEEHPVMGVGPGVFKLEYLAYRVKLTPSWGAQFESPYSPVEEYFREVHNDHLQLLAEAGLPAYLLLLGALGLLAFCSRGAIEGRESVRIARLLSLPLAVAMVVEMLAGFPLQLAPAAYTFALVGGACIAWGSDLDAA